mmetsp:Transcript_29038/g.79704  ORF Transcript_29038/g.79704 Transcript_29038/m.79704 type:complete len:97 (+) Transcript_29038:585-875(+)
MQDDGGGVYVLEFDGDGQVMNYFATLSSNRNCGGGKTPWGSWISCEKSNRDGFVYQTDPADEIQSELTALVETGGNYESFAYDDRDSKKPKFFVLT